MGYHSNTTLNATAAGSLGDVLPLVLTFAAVIAIVGVVLFLERHDRAPEILRRVLRKGSRVIELAGKGALATAPIAIVSWLAWQAGEAVAEVGLVTVARWVGYLAAGFASFALIGWVVEGVDERIRENLGLETWGELVLVDGATEEG